MTLHHIGGIVKTAYTHVHSGYFSFLEGEVDFECPEQWRLHHR